MMTLLEFSTFFALTPSRNPRFSLKFWHTPWNSNYFHSLPPWNFHWYPQQGSFKVFLEKPNGHFSKFYKKGLVVYKLSPLEPTLLWQRNSTFKIFSRDTCVFWKKICFFIPSPNFPIFYILCRFQYFYPENIYHCWLQK